jgi:hypothetical protein
MSREKCPECGIPFSDWFVWDCFSYCFPCFERTRARHPERKGLVICERSANRPRVYAYTSHHFPSVGVGREGGTGE